MSREDLEKIFDVTGIELTPGKPDICLGNRLENLEGCCDECDYYLRCFPEFNAKNQEDGK